jgi:hypothetical protein
VSFCVECAIQYHQSGSEWMQLRHAVSLYSVVPPALQVARCEVSARCATAHYASCKLDCSPLDVCILGIMLCGVE